ncbi:hypothetical protein Cfor_05138, partial [Coptotermes formosanus]
MGNIFTQAPIGNSSDCFNYRKFFRIVLFVVVDANNKFSYLNVGFEGGIFDGEIVKLPSKVYMMI